MSTVVQNNLLSLKGVLPEPVKSIEDVELGWLAKGSVLVISKKDDRFARVMLDLLEVGGEVACFISTAFHFAFLVEVVDSDTYRTATRAGLVSAGRWRWEGVLSVCSWKMHLLRHKSKL